MKALRLNRDNLAKLADPRGLTDAQIKQPDRDDASRTTT